MRKFKTKVITEESQVPHGFRRISSLADSLTDQKKLSDAHTDGFIAAVKLMRSTEDRTGPVWVDAEAAREVLAGDKNRTKKASTDQMSAGQNEAAVIALCEINNGMSLIHATLERLTAAVESIATQPKRDPLEEFANDNGFHDTLSRAAH
jgi:hypothetical protein